MQALIIVSSMFHPVFRYSCFMLLHSKILLLAVAATTKTCISLLSNCLCVKQNILQELFNHFFFYKQRSFAVHPRKLTAPGNALPVPFSLPRAPPASSAIRLLISGCALPSITDCLSTLSFTSPESGRGRQLGPSSSSAESQTHSHLGSTGLCCRAGALLT